MTHSLIFFITSCNWRASTIVNFYDEGISFVGDLQKDYAPHDGIEEVRINPAEHGILLTKPCLSKDLFEILSRKYDQSLYQVNNFRIKNTKEFLK